MPLPESPSSGVATRVLLLDDDRIGLLLTACALRERGFDVVEFDRPDAALAAAADGGFDAVVADVLMPGMDGFEFCRRLRTTPAGASLPVMMLTSLDDEDATCRACDAGATDYCVKSPNWALLALRLRRLLRLDRLERRAAEPGAAPADAAHALHRLARHDPLTGLPNRTWLGERLAATPHGPGTAAVAVLDVDRFRHVGEALGQQASDGLLVEIGRRLAGLVADEVESPGRGRLAAVAHLGADTFALVLDGLPGRDAALEHAQRAISAMQEPFRVGERELFLRISVGLHVDGAEPHDPQQRLARAERARFAAKALGGNRAVVFDASMADTGPDRLEIERDLHYALDRGEMAMWYQPQVDAARGRVVGFESLMRWSRGGSMQPAGSFIPIAEETGQIVPLGEWAIAESCAALAAMRTRGLDDCVLSVNLSCRQLRTGRLPAVIASALAAHRLPGDALEVELTESGMMSDPELAVAQLVAVRALGAGLAVDDFGTGYSSLAYLTRLPLTTLKIDRSFVADVHASERSRAVARTIVALGANLQLRVVAEGVETVEQRDALLALGCNLQQGWLHGRAMPLEDALAFADPCARSGRADLMEIES